MFTEMGHGFGHRFEPLTVCAYDVDVEDIVDLRGEDGRAAAGVTLADLACPWALDRAEGRTPASWRVATDLMAAGAAGILVPSFANRAKSDAANLVLWRWGDAPPLAIAVFDPSGRLPVDQSSWPAG